MEEILLFDEARVQEALDRLPRLDFDLLGHEIRNWLVRDAVVLRAHYSTWIEGESPGQEEVERLAENGKNGHPNAAMNYIEALRYLDTNPPLTRSTFLETHRLIMSRLREPGADEAGMYRSQQSYVASYTSPRHKHVPALVSRLLDLANSDGAVPLKAAIVHAEVARIHPFANGNGRAARALATRVLNDWNSGFERLVVPDLQIGSDVNRYYRELALLGATYKAGAEGTSWILYFLHGLLAETVRIRNQVRTLVQSVEFLEPSLGEDRARGVAFCLARGRMRPSEYAKLAGIAPTTASEHLRSLVEGGFLVAEGQTRRRVYLPGPRAKAF